MSYECGMLDVEEETVRGVSDEWRLSSFSCMTTSTELSSTCANQF